MVVLKYPVFSFRHKALNILLVTDLDDRYAKMGLLNNGHGS
jgi:hypothetical protein